ncbi:MAG: response regulator [Desulfobacterales bacterium]|nr:response regulator [Desulfobacterales bacterium]
MRVLSVDDSETIRKTVQNIMEVIQAEFLEAENGLKALEVLASVDGKVDVILLDWQMPEMDGYEFLTTIKKDKRYRSIPVIMLTTISQKEKMIDAIRAGAKQYITKPFTEEGLIIKILQTLGVESIDQL